MTIHIYNTLTRQKEEFVPLEENKVKMYVCGPTVYNYIHIGNARPPMVFDTVRRYLEYKGYDVQYVSNFTDVDDKILKKAEKFEKVSQTVATVGMVVGYTNLSDDINVNVCKTKHLSNTRSSGSDDALTLVPVSKMSLEECLEFIADDELLEVTPKSLRIRKRILDSELRAKARAKEKKQ